MVLLRCGLVMKLSNWRGQITLFKNNRSTVPISECQGNFNEICSKLAPNEGPIVSNDKQNVMYFLPTLLKNAPLVGRTKEAAIRQGRSLEGKQRSANHVTTANLIVLDLDGVPEMRLKQTSEIEAGKFNLLAFSSYSHGNLAKKGVRCRLVVPVDEPLYTKDYKKPAWVSPNVFLTGS